MALHEIVCPRCQRHGFASELPRLARCYVCGNQTLFRQGVAVVRGNPELSPDPPKYSAAKAPGARRAVRRKVKSDEAQRDAPAA
jgi:hypothetical protein